jgi:SAM-dependent methyltransferase
MKNNTSPPIYSFPRYLASKKSVDDRALNQHVWNSLAATLPCCDPVAPLQVLEIGAGIGTMIERILERGLLVNASYTALDALEENITTALERLPRWAVARGFQVSQLSRNEILLQRQGGKFKLKFEAIDLFDFIHRQTGLPGWDLLIAHAFLDLMDIPIILPRFFNLLPRGGLFYFTINFDGLTLFEPIIDPALDEHILVLYHRTMDERLTAGKPSGDSQAGRHLFAHIQQAGGQILDAGASDWVVFPGPQGYQQDEAYFLHFILNTIHQALQGHPELDPTQFDHWITRRHAQVENHELVYIAHQFDFLGSV